MAIKKRDVPATEEKSIPCSVCEKPLKLIAHGEKYDTETGEVLNRWPIWEKCDKTEHPRILAKRRERRERERAAQGELEQRPKVSISKAEPSPPESALAGKVYQLPEVNRDGIVELVQRQISGHNRETDKPPISIGDARVFVCPADFRWLQENEPLENISLQADPDLTHGYNYVKVVIPSIAKEPYRWESKDD